MSQVLVYLNEVFANRIVANLFVDCEFKLFRIRIHLNKVGGGGLAEIRMYVEQWTWDDVATAAVPESTRRRNRPATVQHVVISESF